LHPRVRQDTLPVEQKAQEIPRLHGFDFRAQPLDGVAMDAREQRRSTIPPRWRRA